MGNKKICIILGTRPEIIKLSVFIRLLKKNNVSFFIIHTNQHYDKEMDRVFFDDLHLPQPKYNLQINSPLHGEQTGRMIIEIEKILKSENPNFIVVEGDTNSVLAGAMAAAKEMNIAIVHVEAGLRSYDRAMPEEINRVIADHISDYLFAPTAAEKQILIKEGIPQNQIFVVGNTIVDAVLENLKISEGGNFQSYTSNDYYLLTLHRPSNVDNESTLVEILTALEEIAERDSITILFPCHPRTLKKMKEFKVQIGKNIEIIKPVGYLEMLSLMKNAKLLLTDSGGIQEEACILQKKCVTIRYNTERPDTIRVGGNILAGNKKNELIQAIDTMKQKRIKWYNPFGDGTTSEQILKILLDDH